MTEFVMAEPLTLGVVIPVFNGRPWIEKTIASVVGATSQRVFIIVVDDGSSDDSASLVLRGAWPQVVLVRQNNAGVAAARSRGLAELPAQVDACLFIDQDDELTSGALDLLSGVLRSSLHASAAVGLPMFVDNAGNPLDPQPADLLRTRRRVVGRRLRPVVNEAVIDRASLVHRNCIYTPGQVLFRREAVSRMGGFRNSAAPDDDWDLYLRLTAQSDLVLVTHVTTLVRRHDRNASRDERVMRTAEIHVRWRHAQESRGPARSEALFAYRLSERRLSWQMLGELFQPGAGPYRVRRFVRSILFMVWSLLGLRVHWWLRRVTLQHRDPRQRRRFDRL